MKKRLSRPEKYEKAIVDIINKMFEIAGHDVSHDDVKDREDPWFQEWTMTVEQNEEWKKWGKKYLMKELRMYAKMAEKEMSMISLMWGLKFSNFDSHVGV
jgi:predicted ArsR family transcriptional regulator